MKDIFFFAATHGPFVHMEEEFLPIIQNLLVGLNSRALLQWEIFRVCIASI